MSNFCILRTEKLKNLAAICSSLDHELRLRETKNADPEKMKINWFSKMEYTKNENGRVLLDNNLIVEEREKAKKRAIAHFKKQLPEKVRKNAVQAVQFMMTASPEIIKDPNFNENKYINACDQWVKQKFGAENVFFISHHRDETTLHTNVFALPKDEKGKLNCRKFLGGKKKLSELQDEFAEAVGKEFGLQRGVKWSKASHQKIKEWYGALQEAIDEHQDIVIQVTKSLPEKDPSESDKEYQEKVKKAVAKALQPFIAETINHRKAEKKARALNATLEQKANTLADERAQAKVNAAKEELSEQVKINVRFSEELEKVENERDLLADENETMRQNEIYANMGKYFEEQYPEEASWWVNREVERLKKLTQRGQARDEGRE